MKPLITIQFDELSDYPRRAAPVMADALEAIATAIRNGKSEGRAGSAEWTIHTETTFDDIRAAFKRWTS